MIDIPAPAGMNDPVQQTSKEYCKDAMAAWWLVIEGTIEQWAWSVISTQWWACKNHLAQHCWYWLRVSHSALSSTTAIRQAFSAMQHEARQMLCANQEQRLLSCWRLLWLWWSGWMSGTQFVICQTSLQHKERTLEHEQPAAAQRRHLALGRPDLVLGTKRNNAIWAYGIGRMQPRYKLRSTQIFVLHPCRLHRKCTLGNNISANA